MKLLKARLKLLLLLFGGFVAALSIIFSIQTFSGMGRVVIGAKNCTEQHFLAEVMAQLIERETDLKVVRKFNLEGTTVCFNALKSKTIDIYIEYTGTAILDILKEPVPQGSLYNYVSRVFQERFGIKWLGMLGFSNQYTLVTRRDLGVKSITELSHVPGLEIAYDPEFSIREEAKLLKKAYGGIVCQQLMDQVLLYFSLGNGTIDVMSGFSTDGRLLDPRFVVLEDDAQCLPAYEAAPMITASSIQKHPELVSVIQKLEGAFTTEEMSYLNYRIEVEGEDVVEVASSWIEQKLF